MPFSIACYVELLLRTLQKMSTTPEIGEAVQRNDWMWCGWVHCAKSPPWVILKSRKSKNSVILYIWPEIQSWNGDSSLPVKYLLQNILKSLPRKRQTEFWKEQVSPCVWYYRNLETLTTPPQSPSLFHFCTLLPSPSSELGHYHNYPKVLIASGINKEKQKAHHISAKDTKTSHWQSMWFLKTCGNWELVLRGFFFKKKNKQ